LGEFKPFSFEYYELPIYMIMGALGGLLGAFWISMNNKLNKFREKYVKMKIAKVLEVN
jgi:chloride channel 7